MLQLFFFVIIQLLTNVIWSQVSPLTFENMVINHPLTDSVQQIVVNRLNQGTVVTSKTLTYVINKISNTNQRLAFIDSILKQSYLEDELRAKIIYLKLFFIQNSGNLNSDSSYIAISQQYSNSFHHIYENELIHFAKWKFRLGNVYKYVNNEQAEIAYNQVLQVSAYGITEAFSNEIHKLQTEAIIGLLQCARGDALKLKSIFIPYPFEMVAFPYYKQYMEELGEKVEFRSSLPKFFKKN